MSRDRGYRFVELPPVDSQQVLRVPRPQARLDVRLRKGYSGRIVVLFVTEQPVHVGSGHKLLVARPGGRNPEIVRGAVQVEGRVGVPGASLKGVLRSRYEAITRSCAGDAPQPTEARSRSRPEAEYAQLAADLRAQPVFQRCRGSAPGEDQRLCPACALFGCMSLRGRITATDLFSPDACRPSVIEVPSQFGPRLHHVGEAEAIWTTVRDRRALTLEVKRLYGRKFYCGQAQPEAGDRAPAREPVEAIPIGTPLQGELRVWNLLPEELGGLLAALGRAPASCVKLGGGKALGLGRMRLAQVQFELLDGRRRPVPVDEEGWRAAFVGTQDRWDRGEAQLVSLHQGTC